MEKRYQDTQIIARKLSFYTKTNQEMSCNSQVYHRKLLTNSAFKNIISCGIKRLQKTRVAAKHIEPYKQITARHPFLTGDAPKKVIWHR